MAPVYCGKISNVVSFNKTSRRICGKIRYLDTGNITSGIISDIQIFSGICDAPSRARRTVKPRDIIYSTVRPNQKHYGYIEDDSEDLIVSTGFTVITAEDPRINSKYLYYYLSQNDVVEYLQSIAEQSTSAYPSITSKDIGDLHISFPKLKIQNDVVAIIDSINDIIRNNTQINDYLVA